MLVKPLVRPIVRAIAGNPTASLGSFPSVGGAIPAAYDWTPAGRFHVMFFGDSITRGVSAGLTDAEWLSGGFVAQLRTTLVARHGDGGPGFIELGRSNWVKTGTWTTNSDFGVFGTMSVASNDATRYWTLTVTEGDNVDIFYLNGAGYGAFDVVVDGSTTTTITPSGSANNSTKIANVSLGSDGAHTIQIKAPASGTLYLLGAAVYKGTTGVVIHNISRSGDSIGSHSFRTSDRLSIVPVINPSLIFLGYVANDFNIQTDLTTYQTRMSTVASFLAASGGDLATWIPPDHALTGRAIAVSSYESIARSTATANGGFWLDVHREWGSYAANVAKMYDTVHPNTTGHTAMHDFFLETLERIGA